MTVLHYLLDFSPDLHAQLADQQATPGGLDSERFIETPDYAPNGSHPVISQNFVTNNNSRLNIIILGKWRAGSTFCSEFFNKHNSIAYLYEPLCKDQYGGSVKNIKGVLDAVLDCRFNTYTNPGLAEVYKPWYRYQMFCVLPDQTPGCSARHRITIRAAEEHCHNTPHKAVKLIRVHSLAFLADYMKAGAKVVHLLRDPRGVIHSRQKIKTVSGNLSAQARIYCDEAIRDLNYVREQFKSKNEHFMRNYYLMRYEDAAAAPLRTMKSLYAFLGIPVDERLHKWVEEQDKKLENEAKGKEGNKGLLRYVYGTQRQNPAFTAEAWRLTMPWTKVEEIQRVCEGFLKGYGYTSFHNQSSLISMDEYIAQPFSIYDAVDSTLWKQNPSGTRRNVTAR